MTPEVNQLKVITEKITSLPTLPTVVTKMTMLLQDPHTTAEEVGKAITNDQSIASKVLKLVNSAFYGFPGRINTITHAIVILGFGTVKNIVLTASIFDSFGGKGDGGAFDIQKFWLHSIGVGAAAKIIARYAGFRSVEECFLAGLLHDIGKIILNQYAKPEMAKVLKVAVMENCLFLDAERKAIKSTHQELGGWLAAKWNLPKDLTSGVEYHHYPPSAPKEHFFMTSVVHVADVFTRALSVGSGGDKKIPKVIPQAWERVGLKESDLQKLCAEIEEEVEKASIFFSLL